jgi:hypothetical protein
MTKYELHVFYEDNDLEPDARVTVECFDNNAAVDYAKSIMRPSADIGAITVFKPSSCVPFCVEVIYRCDLDFDHNAHRAAYYGGQA